MLKNSKKCWKNEKVKNEKCWQTVKKSEKSEHFLANENAANPAESAEERKKEGKERVQGTKNIVLLTHKKFRRTQIYL